MMTKEETLEKKTVLRVDSVLWSIMALGLAKYKEMAENQLEGFCSNISELGQWY